MPRNAADSAPAMPPFFPSYLLPSLKFPIPLRRRPSSSSSTSSSSPSSSPPSSSPPAFFPSPPTTTSSPTRLARLAPDTLRCALCAADIALASQIISKGFTGRHGRALLVAPAPPSSPRSHLHLLLRRRRHHHFLYPSNPSSSFSADDAAAAAAEDDAGYLFHDCRCRCFAAPTDVDAGPSSLLNVRSGPCENRQLVTGPHIVADLACAGCGRRIGWKYVDTDVVSQRYKVGCFILETDRVVTHRAWGDAVPEPPHHHHQPDDPINTSLKDHDDNDGVIIFDSENEDECDDIFAGIWNPRRVARRRERVRDQADPSALYLER